MTFYHKIFVQNIFDKPEDSLLLEKYMYTNDFMSGIIKKEECTDNQRQLINENNFQENVKNTIKVEPVQLPVIHNSIQFEKNKKLDSIIFPEKMDNLFWSIFISVYGYTEYETIGRCYSNREISEKQNIMEFIKKNPKSLKSMDKKITKAMTQEILSDIMSNKKTTLDVLPAFALFYKKNIIILNEKNKNIYLKINLVEDTKEYILLIKNKKGFFGLDTDITSEKIQNIFDTKFCLEHYNKPLKAISNYKSDGLNSIGEMMGLDINIKLKKQELYNEICKLICWE
jgi:hypothetical protein